MPFTLCADCFKRFNKSPSVSLSPGGQCHICGGAISNADSLVASAILQSAGFEWDSFSVSSSFSKSVLIREQEVADGFSPGEFTSLKNALNSRLASSISSLTKKKCRQRGADAQFDFDFSKQTSSARPTQSYVFGHYLKLSRKHCQSRWHCSECGGAGCESCSGSGMNYPSVEDELARAFSASFQSKKCTLHASGREDVDVRCLGTGRPFIMEIASPRIRHPDLGAIEDSLSGNPSVRAVGLAIVGKHFLDAVCNSHFDKKYVATVGADRPLTAKDAEMIKSLAGKTIEQQTPKRVLSRRADLTRKRKIHSISAAPLEGGKLTLEILAEAGTYIKELINSDSGRTSPSVSGLLKCNAVCEALDVVEIRDYFLQTVLHSVSD